MQPFSYLQAMDAQKAVATTTADKQAVFIAGGTNLLDLIKNYVQSPDLLVDINSLALNKIERTANGVTIGALARMSEVAKNPLIVENFPVVSQALLASASPQLRNMASIGGNLLQRTRCYYFWDVATPCNKREPGTGCSALEGQNRNLAILGGSDNCIATNPSDLAVALVALDAVVVTSRQNGERRIPLTEFYLLPGETPQKENVLEHGELIVGVEIPTSDLAARSYYLKVRDRAAFEFALVSVAAALTVKAGKIEAGRIALGGVGTKPWRVVAAENALVGQAASEQTFRAAAEIALQGAVPRKHNAFKVEMAKRAVVQALTKLAEDAQ